MSQRRPALQSKFIQRGLNHFAGMGFIRQAIALFCLVQGLRLIGSLASDLYRGLLTYYSLILISYAGLFLWQFRQIKSDERSVFISSLVQLIIFIPLTGIYTFSWAVQESVNFLGESLEPLFRGGIIFGISLTLEILKVVFLGTMLKKISRTTKTS